MKKNESFLPKKIWFLWFQGQNKMPLVVKKCFLSWQKHHPNWDIIFLDKKNLYDFVEIKYILENRSSKIYFASQSDIIRINLLKKYGGVWVDATCFCQQPLDDWIYNYLNTGFFAFDRPGYDRMFSSWFLAVNKGNQLVEEYANAVNDFWISNKNIKLSRDRAWIHLILRKFKIHGYLKRNPTLWLHPILTKGLKVYSYFWFFYLFEKLYHNNQTVKTIWDSTPKFSADIPHKIQHFGLFEPLNKMIQADIDQKSDPLYKLTYKYDSQKYYQGCLLDYLLNKH